MQLRETAFNTHETTRLSLLINISNSCMWGDEKGKHICHPATTWDVSSLGVNLLCRTTPAILEFPSGAHWPQALLLFLPLLLPDPICPRSTFGTSHRTSINGCLENPLQAWPKKLNQWMLFCSLPHNYLSPFKKQRKCFHVNATLTGQLFSKKWILKTFALPPLCLLEMSYTSAVCSVSVSLRS